MSEVHRVIDVEESARTVQSLTTIRTSTHLMLVLFKNVQINFSLVNELTWAVTFVLISLCCVQLGGPY